MDFGPSFRLHRWPQDTASAPPVCARALSTRCTDRDPWEGCRGTCVESQGARSVPARPPARPSVTHAPWTAPPPWARCPQAGSLGAPEHPVRPPEHPVRSHRGRLGHLSRAPGRQAPASRASARGAWFSGLRFSACGGPHEAGPLASLTGARTPVADLWLLCPRRGLSSAASGVWRSPRRTGTASSVPVACRPTGQPWGRTAGEAPT